jgi:DNA-directed RNA polymerase subunit RPC12/RpoP
MATFKENDFPISCPNCKRQIKTRLSKLTKGSVLRCPSCSMEIRVADRGFENVQKSLKDLFR